MSQPVQYSYNPPPNEMVSGSFSMERAVCCRMLVVNSFILTSICEEKAIDE